MKLKFTKTNERFIHPRKGNNEAACWDLYAASIGVNYTSEGTQIVVNAGFAVEIPEGYKLVIVPRSSISNTMWMLQNSPAVIDQDYRGEIFIKFRYIGQEGRIQQSPFKVGDRIAQCFLEKVIDIEWEEAEELTETERGVGGFGSTGS